MPIVKSIFKGLKPQTKLSGGFEPPDNYANIGDFGTERRIGQTDEAYLLAELLDEKNNVVNPEYARIDVNLTVTGWQPLNLAEKIETFQNECTQSGILRFSLVNDTDYNIWFDDFEITHKQSDEKINVTSWTDYYPYGKVAKTSCPLNGAYRYGYQGEFAEKDSETDWNSFELRQYDSEIGRWLSTDPYRQHSSPYLAMGNNPVSNVDADGGFGQEFGNWMSGKGWMSHEAYAFSQSNADASYAWIGNRLSGHGEFTQGYSDGEGSGILATKFQAVNDLGNDNAFNSFAAIAANQVSFLRYLGELDPQEGTRIFADAATDALGFTPFWGLVALKAGYEALTGRNPVREFMGAYPENNQEDKIDQYAGNYPGSVMGVYDGYGATKYHKPPGLYAETSRVARGMKALGAVGTTIGVSKTLFDGLADKENNPYEGVFWESR